MTPSPRRSSPVPLPAFDPATLQRVLDGDQAPIRRRVREILSRPSFRYLPPDASIDAQREAASGWCRELAAEGIGALPLPAEHGGRGDYAAFTAAFETVAFHDISLTIKFTVQFGLWAGSILLLGREEHHRRYLRDIGSFALPGCFALTEIGHGSNARELETVARYEPASGQFVISSPGFSAGKNYIGNLVRDGRAATVFAQLETADGTRHGVHALVVPLRDAQGNVLPGVRIEDNGPKMGENGVDNGRVWFDDVRVDRDALLDRFGGVAPDGTYVSPIKSASARFFAIISALVGGRIGIAVAAISAAKSGLAIAVRYAERRRQFRTPGVEGETPLLQYPTHQRRLMPLLANAYAVDFAHKYLVRRRVETQDGHDPAGTREVEILAAGLKAWATWNTTRTLQTCRETCGGEGYISANRLPALKADTDIFTTFEGDNTVLMLWIGRNLLAVTAKASGTDHDAVTRDGASDEDHAGDVYLPLFVERERAMLADIQGELARLAGEGVDAQAAAARQQMRLFRLAQAHVERVVLEQFGAVVARVRHEDTALGEVLGALHELFALTLLEEQRGWFLENGLLTPAESKTLPEKVEALCAQVAPRAVALVNAFGIPAQCLAAPIALP